MNAQKTEDRLLSRAEVTARTGLPRSTLYRLMTNGEFPTNVRLGPRVVRWSLDEVEAWLATRPRFERRR